ncbi:cupin domain-containing protein [Lachnospiraceae bacterium 62-35]
MFVTKDDIKVTNMPDGVVRRMLGFGDKIMACEMTFPKGAYVEPHCHDSHQQMVYVLRGKFELQCGDEKRVMSPGDLCYCAYNEIHATLSLEDGSTILDVHTPLRKDIIEESMANNASTEA